MRLVRMTAVALALALGMAIGSGNAAAADNCSEIRSYADYWLSEYDSWVDMANTQLAAGDNNGAQQSYQLALQAYEFADYWMGLGSSQNCPGM